MAHTILQLFKAYKSNAPLLNSMVRADSEEFTTVVCYLSGHADGSNEMESVASKTIYCGLRKSGLYWTKISTLRKVAKIIDDNHIDILVCQFRRTLPIGVLAALLSKRKPKIVGVIHGIVGGANSVGRRLVNFFIYRRLDKIVAVSASGADEIVSHNISVQREDVCVIPNGILCDRFSPSSLSSEQEAKTPFPESSKEDFVFFMVGRLAPVKNHVRVLHAFKKLLSDFPHAKLAIAGRGPVEAQLTLLSEEMGIAERVLLLGFREDVPLLLRKANVFLMPSIRESFGLALGEAMLSKLPAITSDKTGTTELIPDERYGYLVDPNSIESIYQAMLRMMRASPDELSTMTSLARERVLTHYNAAKMADNYETLYRQLVSVAK